MGSSRRSRRRGGAAFDPFLALVGRAALATSIVASTIFLAARAEAADPIHTLDLHTLYGASGDLTAGALTALAIAMRVRFKERSRGGPR